MVNNYSGHPLVACTKCCHCNSYGSVTIGFIMRQYQFMGAGRPSSKNALPYLQESSATPPRLYSHSTLARNHADFLLSYCRNLASSLFSYGLVRLQTGSLFRQFANGLVRLQTAWVSIWTTTYTLKKRGHDLYSNACTNWRSQVSSSLGTTSSTVQILLSIVCSWVHPC